MTISSTTRKAGPFVGNGVTTEFPFDFKLFSTSDLRVVRADALGVETDLVHVTDCTVTLNADQDENPGGSVVLNAPLAEGTRLVLLSAVPELQPVDLTNQGGFYPELVNGGLDRVTVLLQQLLERMGRSITVPVTSEPGDLTLPSPTSGQLLGWTDSGLTNFDPSELVSVVAYGATRVDKFTGDGTTTAFTLSTSPGVQNNLRVSIGGVVQVPGEDFTWSGGTTLVFTVAPPAGTRIVAQYQEALLEFGAANADLSNVNPQVGREALGLYLNPAPVPTGVPAVDTPLFQTWLNTPSAYGHHIMPGGRTLRAFTIPSNIRLHFHPGAVLKRDPSDTAFLFVSASGASNVVITGLADIDGQASLASTAFSLVDFDACRGFDIEHLRVRNAKAVAGSYGVCFNWRNSTDYANASRSRVGLLEIDGGGFGTYGGQIDKSWSITIEMVKATGCPNNAGFAIHNFDLPVPVSPTQSFVKIGGYEVWGNGIGFEAFGFRSGVGVNGDIAARQSTSTFFDIGPGQAYDNSIHSVAFQGSGFTVGLISSKANGLGFSNRGGPLINAFDSVFAGIVSEGDGYFGCDLGGSTRVSFGPISVKGFGNAGTGIGVNLGATVGCFMSRIDVLGMPTSGVGVRLARFDGSGASNWFEWGGQGTKVASCRIEITNVAQVGVQTADGYDALDISGECIMYAAGTAFDFKGLGAGCIIGDCRATDSTTFSSVVSVAGASALVVPDHAREVVVTGGAVNVSTLRFAGDEYYRARPRFCRASAQGSGYNAADTSVSFTTDGTAIGAGPAVTGTLVITGDGKIVGAVMDVSNCNKNATTCTANITTTSGTGAVLVVTLGGRNTAGRRKLDFFPAGNGTTAPTFKNGSFQPDEFAIGADRLASQFNLSVFSVQSDTTFWKQTAWSFNA